MPGVENFPMQLRGKVLITDIQKYNVNDSVKQSVKCSNIESIRRWGTRTYSVVVSFHSDKFKIVVWLHSEFVEYGFTFIFCATPVS